VQDDAHSGIGGEEDAPQQQEYDDVEENDHDQQEAPVPDSPLVFHSDGPAETVFLTLGMHQPSCQSVVLLSDGS
jgi:hypothetical protein